VRPGLPLGLEESKGTVRAVSAIFNSWLGQLYLKGLLLRGNGVAYAGTLRERKASKRNVDEKEVE
jgi:hypothetical protein